MEHHLSVPEVSVDTVLPSGVRYRGRGIVVGQASFASMGGITRDIRALKSDAN